MISFCVSCIQHTDKYRYLMDMILKLVELFILLNIYSQYGFLDLIILLQNLGLKIHIYVNYWVPNLSVNDIKHRSNN